MAEYAGINNGHTLGRIEQDGAIAVLDDGSQWRVYEGFVSRVSLWQAGEMIRVKQNKRDLEYPYLLINIHKNEQVETAFLSG